MKQSLAKSPVSPQQSELEGDPYFLCATPIVAPLFAPSQEPFHREIAAPLAKLGAFINHPTVETMELAQEGAATLCSLMEKTELRASQGGRAVFRRDFAVATLDQIRALDASSESLPVFERMLLEIDSRGSRRLSDSILAGITDLNEACGARLRRLYSRKGGLCDRLAHGFEQVIDVTHEIRSEYRRKTCERFDATEPVAKILRVLTPLVSKAREAMALVSSERALPAQFEERVANTLARLEDYHLPDAARLMEGLVGDMRELKHILLSMEGLDKGLGNRLELSRTRRSARPPVTPS